MRPVQSRRSHKKSRTGCERCKKRKIKCDEAKPRCGQCVKHSVTCDYEHPELKDELRQRSAPLDGSPAGNNPFSPVPASVSVAVSGSGHGPGLGDGHAGYNFNSPLLNQGAVPAGAGPSMAGTPVYSAAAAAAAAGGGRTIPLDRSLPPPSSGPTPVSRFLELRLMHHYTLHTCKTFTFTAPETENIWKIFVPQLAFGGAPHLADAVLAVTALHLRSRSPDDKELIQASHFYMGSSLREYSAALNRGIDENSAEALFLTSTLIAFQSTATRTFMKDEPAMGPAGNMGMDGMNGFDRAPATGVYTVPFSLFHSFQGVKAVTAHSWPYIRHSPVVNQIINSQQALQLDFEPNKGFFDRLLVGMEEELSTMEARIKPYPSPEGYLPSGNIQVSGHEADPFSALSHNQQHLQAPPNPGAPGVPAAGPSQEQQPGQQPPSSDAHTTRQAYQHAVAVLNWAHKIPHRGAPLAFPATVSRRFVELLEERRPRAMAILACYFALLRSLDGVWWLHGLARREVLGVVSLFNNDFFGAEAGRRWMPELKWALDIALYENKDKKVDANGQTTTTTTATATQPEVVVDHDLGTFSIPPEVWGADWASEEEKLKREKEREGQDYVSQIDLVSQMASPVQSVPAVPDTMSIGELTRSTQEARNGTGGHGQGQAYGQGQGHGHGQD